MCKRSYSGIHSWLHRCTVKENFPFSTCCAKAVDKVIEGRGAVSVEKTVVVGKDPGTLTSSTDFLNVNKMFRLTYKIIERLMATGTRGEVGREKHTKEK